MPFSSRGALDALRSLFLAAIIIVIGAAMVPRGHTLHHLAHPGVWSRVVRSHASRRNLNLAAVHSAGHHGPPRSSWRRGVETISPSAETLLASAAVRLRAPPFSS